MSLKPHDLGRLMYESAPGDDVELHWDDLLNEARDRWTDAAIRYERAKLQPPADEQDSCECGKPLRWDPDDRGVTCGGLDVVGAWVCCGGVVETCHVHRLGKLTRAAEAVDWKLAKGGRSLDCGGIRLRGEGGEPGELVALLARVAQLPRLERIVQKIDGGS